MVSDSTASKVDNAREFVRVRFRVPAVLADEAAGVLVARGALGCAVAARSWTTSSHSGTVALEAYFKDLARGELGALRVLLNRCRMLARNSRNYAPELVMDPGWATMWMKRFEPFRVGRRFLICPPWNSSPGEANRLRIVIKPGRAFGTGHHATTRGVLRAVEQLRPAHDFRSVLDVGTGSGVLAIAMKLLGASEVLAIDSDSEALANARENAVLNGLDSSIQLSDRSLRSLRRRFDLIAANITASTLTELAPCLQARLSQRGVLVLSGVLRREMKPLLAHYAPAMRCLSSRVERGWATLVIGR